MIFNSSSQPVEALRQALGVCTIRGKRLRPQAPSWLGPMPGQHRATGRLIVERPEGATVGMSNSDLGWRFAGLAD